jgi:hypothetical protein
VTRWPKESCTAIRSSIPSNGPVPLSVADTAVGSRSRRNRAAAARELRIESPLIPVAVVGEHGIGEIAVQVNRRAHAATDEKPPEDADRGVQLHPVGRHQRDAGLLAGLDDLSRARDRRGKRFLDDDVLAERGGRRRVPDVDRVRRGDVDGVVRPGRLPVRERIVGDDGGDAVLVGDGPHGLRRTGDERRRLAVVALGQRGERRASREPAHADDREPQTPRGSRVPVAIRQVFERLQVHANISH